MSAISHRIAVSWSSAVSATPKKSPRGRLDVPVRVPCSLRLPLIGGCFVKLRARVALSGPEKDPENPGENYDCVKAGAYDRDDGIPAKALVTQLVSEIAERPDEEHDNDDDNTDDGHEGRSPLSRSG